ncbi:MAG: secretin N-terminal domain-containing protein [Candidatus Omnitrophica bacterium]|nr:secretin N-terminal domain-containing protein [Candidatus Omnitrophota bacterium]
MKKLLLSIIFCSSILPIARAEIKDFVYDGKEIYVHVKKDHVTTVIFPESINGVIRGFGADTYVVQRNNNKPNMLELMPTDLEAAEMTVTGISGESYVLRFVANDDFYTKFIIHRIAASDDKNEDKTIAAKMDILSESVIEKKGAIRQTAKPALMKAINVEDQVSRKSSPDLPPELNLKITLKGNDLPLKIYLSTISQVTRYNIITTPDIDSQKTSINLENIEVWRALKSLLYKFGYGFKVSREDLIITETETRIFNINMPAVDQSFTDETSNASFVDSNNNNSISTNNQQNQDIKVGTKIYYENTSPKLSLWADLENNVKSIITPNTGSYSLNKVSGSIVVTDKPAVLDKVGELVSTINENLGRQQSFEIQIIEVTLSRNHETGIDWNTIAKSLKGLNNITAATNFSSAGFLSGQLLTLSAAGPDSASGATNGGVSMVLKALDSMGDVNVVSRPSITVSNMFPCVIQEVTSVPYISGTGQTIGNNITQSNVTTSQVSDGLTMRLEAKIEENKTVLNISAALNTLDSMTNVAVGNGLTIQEPQVSTKSITTNVGVEPEKTLILGGLISSIRNNSTEGIPYLDKIPFLGNAFEYKVKSSKKTELVIIITPKSVIRNI